ncbi:hypothetical protein SAMN05421690_106117, partial [Nitrosomonas sp. Nm51]
MQRYTGARANSNTIKQLTEADLAQLNLSSTEILGLQTSLAIMHALQEQIDRVEAVLESYCRAGPAPLFGYSKALRGLARCWRQSFCLRPATSHGLPASAIMFRTVVVSVVRIYPTVKRKAAATPGMATG